MPDKLFDYVCIVKLREGSSSNEPYADYVFPPLSDEEKKDPFIQSICQFCFPDPTAFPADDIEAELFTFVLTDNSGSRRNGYCRHVLPPGEGPRLPICFCLISFIPCLKLFAAVLEEVSSRYEHSTGSSSIFQFLQGVLAHPLPNPGDTFYVKAFAQNGQRQHLEFQRPDDSDYQLDNFNLEPLFLHLSPVAIVTVFASLLVERRMIFSSASVITLSSCVQACMAFLYPFTWQHIFIPVLPRSMLSFCCAPMPFVVGVLESCLPEVATLPMDEVFIVDLDDNEFIRRPYNELKILPSHLASPLLKTLTALCKHVKKLRKAEEGKCAPPPPLNINKELGKGLIGFFVSLLQNYRQYIRGAEFDRVGFLEAAQPSSKKYLELLVGSQMFEAFVAERSFEDHGRLSTHGKFDRRVTMMIERGIEPDESHPTVNTEWDDMVAKFMEEECTKQDEATSKARNWKDLVMSGLGKAKAKALEYKNQRQAPGVEIHAHSHTGGLSVPLLGLASKDSSKSPMTSRSVSPSSSSSSHIPLPPPTPQSKKSRSRIKLSKKPLLKEQLAEGVSRLASTKDKPSSKAKKAHHRQLEELSGKLGLRATNKINSKRAYSSDTRLEVSSHHLDLRRSPPVQRKTNNSGSGFQKAPQKPQPPLPPGGSSLLRPQSCITGKKPYVQKSSSLGTRQGSLVTGGSGRFGKPRPKVAAQNKPKPTPKLKPSPKKKPVPKPKPKPPFSQRMVGSKPKPKPKLSFKPKPKPGLGSKPKPKPRAKFGPGKPKPKPKFGAKFKPRPKLKCKPKPKAKGAYVKPKPKPKPKGSGSTVTFQSPVGSPTIARTKLGGSGSGLGGSGSGLGVGGGGSGGSGPLSRSNSTRNSGFKPVPAMGKPSPGSLRAKTNNHFS